MTWHLKVVIHPYPLRDLDGKTHSLREMGGLHLKVGFPPFEVLMHLVPVSGTSDGFPLRIYVKAMEL
jgi:hypothetical protein